jgi:membrane associated rhomboid family serine protease
LWFPIPRSLAPCFIFHLDTGVRSATVWPFRWPSFRLDRAIAPVARGGATGGIRVLIPISHEEQRVARLPWVTIALVAANVLAFLITLPAVERQATETQRRIEEVLRFAVEHPYLQLPEEIAHVVPARRPPPNLSAETIADEQARLDRLWSELEATAAVSVYRTYGYIPAEPHLLTLFTSMFMHGGWMHLLGNMLFLWLSGGSLEDRWGRIFYPILYLVSGVAATLMHAAMTPQSHIPLVGASGAIAGLMGAFLIRLATTRIRFFYWIFLFRGTFEAPAYVMLPLWLLQQFVMARTGTEGGVAVWAHIGGFVLGAVVAILVRLTDLEEKVLAPAIKKKTTWTASDRLTAALGRLDQGDVDGAIKDLEALLRATPDNIEARTSLIDAHARKGDHTAAGRESARLVGAYLKARDMAGARAAAREHKQAFPDVPLLMRDQLALAADCEKREDYQEAAARYQEAIATGPDDPLAPKALVGFGRLLFQVFKEPGEALEVLERARTHPRATPEFQQASEEMIALAKGALPPASEPPTTIPQAPPEPPGPEPSPHLPTPEVPTPEEPVVLAPAAMPVLSLAPVPARAVGIDARGLTLQDRRGGTGHLLWQKVTAVSVATIGQPQVADQAAETLILDLIMGSSLSPPDGRIRCIRLSINDLAIPQLQSEPSPLRAFQRLVATILKATGATAHPSREACLGLNGFPTFPDLAAYEADLVPRLSIDR